MFTLKYTIEEKRVIVEEWMSSGIFHGAEGAPGVLRGCTALRSASSSRCSSEALMLLFS